MLNYLNQALCSDHGIVILATPVEKVRQALYRARQNSDNPAFEYLQFLISPQNPDGEIWIVKETPNGQD